MDILLALIAIIAVVVRIVNSSKVKKIEQAKVEQQKNVNVEMKKVLNGQKKSDNKDYEGVNRPGAEGYGQTTVEKQNISREAFSAEGTESNEGKCIEPNANHCAVEHEADSIYITEITDESVASFTREDMVKGVIMAEILSKPKSLQ